MPAIGTTPILVVEDEQPKVAELHPPGLAEEGTWLDVAMDGAGLNWLGTFYDLIVLDVMLPKRDGFAVLRTLRKHRMAATCSC